MRKSLIVVIVVASLGTAAAMPVAATGVSHHRCPGLVARGYSHIETTGISCREAKHAIHHARTRFLTRHHRLFIRLRIRHYRCVHAGTVNFGTAFRCGRNSAPHRHYFRFALTRI
jgi:hypothetical protein